jgi:methylenetetrahydrofolate--tRNA-(uracil-5-)-methyltransferase
MLAARLRGRELAPPPPQTAIGALHLHVTRPRGAGERFAPSNIHFGLLPPLRLRAHRRERRFLYAERGRHAFEEYLRDGPLL